MESRAFIERMVAIETELREARQSRHDRNTAINNVVDGMRAEQMDSDRRLTLVEVCLARITQLLDGYQGQGGLVSRVGELSRQVADMPHTGLSERVASLESRTVAIERKLYIATGALIALQILFGLGIIPNVFAR
jgi:hypothetical protein